MIRALGLASSEQKDKRIRQENALQGNGSRTQGVVLQGPTISNCNRNSRNWDSSEVEAKIEVR